MSDTVTVKLAGMSTRRRLLLQSMIDTVASKLSPEWHLVSGTQNSDVTLYDPDFPESIAAESGIHLKVVARDAKLEPGSDDPALIYPPTTNELREFCRRVASKMGSSPTSAPESKLAVQSLTTRQHQDLIDKLIQVQAGQLDSVELSSHHTHISLSRQGERWQLNTSDGASLEDLLHHAAFWHSLELQPAGSRSEIAGPPQDATRFIWALAQQAARAGATGSIQDKAFSLGHWPLIPHPLIGQIIGMRMCVELGRERQGVEQLLAASQADRHTGHTFLIAGLILGFLNHHPLAPRAPELTVAPRAEASGLQQRFLGALRAAFSPRRKAS